MLQKLIFFMSVLFINAQESHFIKNNEEVIHYKTYGKGKPIVIINGGPGMNCEGFGFIAETLAKMNYQTIIYDQRGTGKSTLKKIDSTTISMDLMVKDLEVIRKHLKIEKWIVMGHSFGGILATHYVAKHSKSIEKIIFSSSGGVNMKFLETFQQRFNANLTPKQIQQIAELDKKIDNNTATTEDIKARAILRGNAYVYDKSFATVIGERLLQVNYTINELVINDLMKIKFDYTNKFKNLDIPILVLQGENDVISIETAKEVVNSFKNATFVPLEKCGHYGWLDAKNKYLSSIELFLKK